jgi:hypothetical protein
MLAATLLALAPSLFCQVAEAANPCVTAADEAQNLKSAGKLREARASFLVCAQRTCNSVVRASCEKFLQELEEQTPSVIVRVVDSRGHDVLGARVTIDEAAVALDGTPVAVDPGQHVIRAKARSGDLAEQKALVALGEKARVIRLSFDKPLEQDGTRGNVVTRAKPPVPVVEEPSNTVPIVLGTVGAIGVIAFVALEIAAQSKYSDLEAGCLKTRGFCTQAETDPAKEVFVGAGVSLGIAVVALGAAAIVYFTRKPSPAAVLYQGGAVRF